MKLVTMIWEETEKLGLILDEEVAPLDQFGFSFSSMNDLILNISDENMNKLKNIKEAKVYFYSVVGELNLAVMFP